MDLFNLFFSKNSRNKRLRGGGNNAPKAPNAPNVKAPNALNVKAPNVPKGNAPKEGGFMNFIKTMSWLIALLAAVVSVICLILIIIAMIKMGQVDENKINITKNTKDINTLEVNYDKYFNQLQTNVSGQSIGATGPQGMMGPQGPAGGLFSGFGQMINSESQKSVNVTAGKGLPAIAYMDNKGNAPNKYWYLENNGNNVMIRNKFTNFCLEADKNTGDVYSQICNKDKGNQNFVWTKDGKLNLNNTGKCIATKSFQLKNYPNSRIVDTEPKGNKNAGIVQKLNLDNCQTGYYPPQSWVFG